MTIKDALETTKKVFDATIKSGLVSNIEDAAVLNEVYQYIQFQLTKKDVPS